MCCRHGKTGHHASTYVLQESKNIKHYGKGKVLMVLICVVACEYINSKQPLNHEAVLQVICDRKFTNLTEILNHRTAIIQIHLMFSIVAFRIP